MAPIQTWPHKLIKWQHKVIRRLSKALPLTELVPSVAADMVLVATVAGSRSTASGSGASEAEIMALVELATTVPATALASAMLDSAVTVATVTSAVPAEATAVPAASTVVPVADKSVDMVLTKATAKTAEHTHTREVKMF